MATDPFAHERAAAEKQIAAILGRALTDQEKRLLGNIPPKLEDVTNLFGRQHMVEITRALEDFAVTVGISHIDAAPYLLEGRIFLPEVHKWALEHAYEMSSYLNDTTRQVVGDVISKFMETPGMTRADVEAMLTETGIFSPARASMIAVTETTSAASAGTAAAIAEARGAGLDVTEVWQTLNDDLVCEICGPLDGTTPADGWPVDRPPAHTNCRCGSSLFFANSPEAQ
jgi:hypothetical protein